jgi:arylsulfatase A-like enzyme
VVDSAGRGNSWSRRWAFAATSLGAVLVAALAGTAGAKPGAAARLPGAAARAAGPLNVVFIVSDDERVQGNAVMKNVGHLLARHGVTFTNFDVTTSECGPSRATILTGLYSHHTGVTDNFGPHGYPAFHEGSDLAVWLHHDGYETALVGKYLNDYSLDGHGRVPPGWDDWQAMDSVPLEKYYDYKLDENGRIVRFGHRPADYSTTVLTQRAVSFLRSARRPFFLYFAPVAPHLPAVPAPRDVGKPIGGPPFDPPSLNQADISAEPWASWHSRSLTRAGVAYTDAVRRHQLQSLLSVDRGVKQIVDTLASRHELDRTVIFYTSDNGFLWGEHRLGGKLWPYRESTHVPLIVRTPWTEANGTKNGDPILNIDFASTISALAGIRPGLLQDGASFLPMLHGTTIPWRRDYLIEYLGQNKLRDGGPPPYVAIRTPRFLYVRYRYHGWQELYDVRRDPWELHNVVAEPRYAAALAALRGRLAHLYAEHAHRELT